MTGIEPSRQSGESGARRTRYVWPDGEPTESVIDSGVMLATAASRQSLRQRRMSRAPTGKEPSVVTIFSVSSESERPSSVVAAGATSRGGLSRFALKV